MAEYKTCRTIDGGSPKCGLGCIQKNKRIEVKGQNFEYLINRATPYSLKTVTGRYVPIHNTAAQSINKTCDLLILLEGIGDEEDQSNSPVSFHIKKHLEDCIAQSGISYSNVYVTPMVKCAPPKGRKASTKEIAACLAHFKVELELIQPKVVLLVGGTTLRAFNLHNEGGIFKNRGKIFNLKYPEWEDGPTFKVIPTFHPNMFYYKKDPIAERRMRDDYILAANVIKDRKIKVNKPKNSFRLIKTTDQFDQMIKEIQDSKLVAFDTESRGLNFRKEPMTVMSFCWGYDDDNPSKQTATLPIYYNSPKPNSLGWYLEPYWGINKIRAPYSYLFNELRTKLFENEQISKAAHNMKYDWQVIRQWAKCELKGVLYDSILLHHLICEQKPHDLKYLADLELATGDYGNKVDKIGNSKGFDRVPNHILWPYAALDAENVYRLTCIYNFYILNRILDPKFPNRKLGSVYYEKTMPLIETLMESEQNGVKMNRQKIVEFKQDYDAEQDKILSYIRQQVNDPDFNPRSPDNLVKVLTQAGFANEITDISKVKGFNTDRNVLLNLVDRWPLANDIIKYRTNSKMISTYLEHALNELDEDDRIRKSFLIHGTETGRLSCTFLHQIPKPSRSGLRNLRELFEAETGYLFGYMDFKQVEFKVFSVLTYILTGDRSFMDMAFDPKIDAHKKTASMLIDIPVDLISSRNRELGKTLNFGIIYGSEGQDLVKQEWEDLDGNIRPMTWDLIKIGLRRFHNEIPSVKAYSKMVPDIARQQNNIYVNVFGRERHMGESLNSTNLYRRGAAERELVNFTVSSTANQIALDTLVLLYKTFKLLIDKGQLKRHYMKISNIVHDSLMLEFHEKLKDWVVPIIKNTAERRIPELDNKNFTVDIGIGKTWAAAESKENKIKW